MGIMQGAQTSEDNLGSQSQPGPCGYIYFYPLATYPLREVATLGTGYAGHRCLTVPLLCGITVEPGFSINVKALHRRPDPNCGLLRATSYHRDIYVFHNAHMVPPIFEGPGLEALCGETREVFGYDAYSALPRESSKPGDFFPEGLDPSAYLGAVAITEAFKERLYSGNLVAIPSLKQEVAVGQSASVRVPLYDKEVFPEGVPQLRQFYNSDLSRCMHEALYTGLAQALRVRRVGKLVELLEKQSLQDQAKVAKVAPLKEFPASTISHPDSGALMIVDSAACELAVSYAPAMLEASHETPASLNYDSWPLFADCEGPEARVAALHRYNASLAPHVSTQIFATNSVLYVSGVSKSTGQGKESLFNSFYMTHGLGTLQEGTWDPCRRPCFSGWGGPDVTGTNGPGNYAVEHLVYAASFSPNLLARYAYYLQFCQGQKSSLTPVPETGSYVAGAAASPMCSLCEGRAPAVCLNTLFFRLRDRFPPVMSTQRRDPYVISGASGSYNETDFLGNFLNFIDKEDDGQRPDDEPRYTYWQLNQNLLERLSRLGIDAEGKLEKEPHGPRDFVKMFKDVDAAVDAEVVQFMNSMAKNNITYKDLVKSCYHVMQYSCNPFAQPACPIFTQLFYRSLLTILQDISLPICMCYENDNPGLGQSPPEWLKGHYQTLCTNFRSLAIDKGVLTAKEAKVVHGEPTCDLPDLDAALQGRLYGRRLPVRMSKVLMLCPRNIKIKNRVVFTGENAALQNSFIKSTTRRENYIINGPYMKFLNTYHKTLFPDTKLSSLYLWHNFSRRRSVPVPSGASAEEYSDLALFVDGGSRAHEESNVIDVVPGNLVTYAKQRLNNAILKACGQTQFYISLIQGLVPRTQSVPARDYPHVLGTRAVESAAAYAEATSSLTATTVVCAATDCLSQVCKARPVVTLPVTINKYTGVNGNNQIFQAGNLGYFMGRGVDRNLLQAPGAGLRKQAGGSSMRKKFVFATPTLGLTVKRRTQAATTYEIENIRAGLEAIISQKQEEDCVFDVVCNLVDAMGEACASLTRDDAEYLLGRFSVLADSVLETLATIASSGIEWTAGAARDFLEGVWGGPGAAQDNFISVAEPVSTASQASAGLLLGGGGQGSGGRRKRRLATALPGLEV